MRYIDYCKENEFTEEMLQPKGIALIEGKYFVLVAYSEIMGLASFLSEDGIVANVIANNDTLKGLGVIYFEGEVPEEYQAKVKEVFEHEYFGEKSMPGVEERINKWALLAMLGALAQGDEESVKKTVRFL